MTKPARMEVKAENIPLELLHGKKWIVWNWEKRNGRWTKPLYNPKTGQLAKSDDPSTWTTFAEAWRGYESRQYDGIGFVLCSADGFCGIDYDKVRDPANGDIDPEALARIRAINSYTEISPSQQGLKTIVKAKLPGRDRQSEHYSFYTNKRYFTITGHIFDGISPRIEKRQEQVTQFYKELFPSEETPDRFKNEHTQPPHNIEDSKIIEKALKANDGGKFKDLWEGDWSGYQSQSEADQALCNKLAFWVGPDPARIDALFRQSDLMRDKWDRQDYRTNTIAKAITRTTEVYSPSNNPIGGKPQSTEFPAWVMSGLAGDFAKVYNSYLEVPAHFFYMAFLTCLGSVVADNLTLASEIAPQPRLFVLLLGESADDRKSTALNKVVDFFKMCVEGFGVCWGVGSAEGLQKRLEDSRRLLLCFDEFKQFISKCKIEASVLLPCVNTLFESNRYESRTKKTDINLDNVYLSLVAASTLDTYENTWSSQFTDIGFNNRLFLVPGSGERKYSFPAKIPDNEKYLLKQRLAELLRHVGNGLELDISTEGRELYHQWYMGLVKSVYTKRLDVYALRLMSLLAVNDLRGEVDPDVVKKVIALCDWQFSVRALHDPIDADNAIAGMEEKLRRVLKARGSLTDRDLKRHTNASRTGLWAYNTARKNLMAHNEVGFNRKEKTYFLRG